MQINPVSHYKILSCYDKITEALSGKMPIPRTLELFISNVCNHKCLGCHSKSLHASKHKFLELKKLRPLIDEAAEMGIKGIEISGGGEPLLHPDVLEIVTYIKRKGLKTGLLTNGSCVTDEGIKVLVDNLLFIRVAFEGSNKNTYKTIHGVDDLDKVIRNVEKIVEVKRKSNSKITIGLKALISQVNYNEIFEIAKRAKLLQVDYVQFKALRRSESGIPEAMFSFVEESLNNAKRFFNDDSFQVLGNIQKTKVHGRCFLNPLHPVVAADGSVYLCAFFQHRMDTHRIGSIYKDSFRDIWISDEHMKAFKNTDPEKCKMFDCPFHTPVEFIKEVIIKGKMHLEFI